MANTFSTGELSESGVVVSERASKPASLRLFLKNPKLLGDFREGKRRTLELVYEAYFGDVARLVRCGFVVDGQGCVRGVASSGEQAELTQEVFARAFSKPSRYGYDGRRPYRCYLLGIAKNVMIDRVRKNGREIPVVSPDELDAGDPSAISARPPDIEDHIHWKDRREATLRYMEMLTPTLQEFVRLRFIEDQSQKCVASSMGMSRKRIRTLEKRLFKGLARYLEEEGLIDQSDEVAVPIEARALRIVRAASQ